MRTHLTRRNGTYYIRVRVPRGSAPAVTRHEIVRSLHTREHLTALEMLPYIEIGIRSRLRDARTTTDRNDQADGVAARVDLDGALRRLQREAHGATARMDRFRPGQHGHQDDALDDQITSKVAAVETAIERARARVGQNPDAAADTETGSAGRDDRIAEIEQLT